MPTKVLKILTSAVCILVVFAALAGFSSADSSTAMENLKGHHRRTKRVAAVIPIISSVVGPLRIFLKLLGNKNADKVEFVLNALTGVVTPWLTAKAKEDLATIRQELSVIKGDLGNLRNLFQDQAMKSDYGRAEEDINAAVWSLQVYQEEPTGNLLNDFLEAAKPIRSRVQFLLDGLIGRHKIADDIISTLVKVHLCRSRKVEEIVGEFVALIKAGILVEDLKNQMRNSTWNERKPFHDYVTKATEELDKVLAAQLKKCRPLNDVKLQMRRILDAHADEDLKTALDQVFGYLSDRYDQHHWFVLACEQGYYCGSPTRGLAYYLDFAFYQAKTSMGRKHNVAALPVARRQLTGDDLQQARNFLINSFCVILRNDSLRTYASEGMNEFVASNGFHYASFPMTSRVLWTHSPGMDLAYLPYRNGSCRLGYDGSYLFAIAPSYKIPADHIPTNRSMALISTWHDGGALTASSPDSSRLTFAPYTGQPGQQWKLIDGLLRNDLGMCATFQSGGAFSGRSAFNQNLCDDYGIRHVWHLNTDHHLFRSCEFEERHINRCPERPAASGSWYFSEDGKRALENKDMLLPMERAGRPLVHARSGLILTVPHNDPTSATLVLDKDKGWSGQRWRFEGKGLINDLNNCLMTWRYGDKVLEQLPCENLKVFITYVSFHKMWSFQDGYIKNRWNGLCVGSESERSNPGDPVILRDCSDSAALLQWIMEDYMGPLPPRPAAPTRPAASRALVNGFGLALTVKDGVTWPWQWLIQETYRGRSGQRWYLYMRVDFSTTLVAQCDLIVKVGFYIDVMFSYMMRRGQGNSFPAIGTTRNRTS